MGLREYRRRRVLYWAENRRRFYVMWTSIWTGLLTAAGVAAAVLGDGRPVELEGWETNLQPIQDLVGPRVFLLLLCVAAGLVIGLAFSFHWYTMIWIGASKLQREEQAQRPIPAHPFARR